MTFLSLPIFLIKCSTEQKPAIPLHFRGNKNSPPVPVYFSFSPSWPFVFISSFTTFSKPYSHTADCISTFVANVKQLYLSKIAEKN